MIRAASNRLAYETIVSGLPGLDAQRAITYPATAMESRAESRISSMPVPGYAYARTAGGASAGQAVWLVSHHAGTVDSRW